MIHDNSKLDDIERQSLRLLILSYLLLVLLDIFDVAEISYAATSRLLVNKEEYPNLFRTLPSDYQQAEVITDVLSYFNWSYVATVSVDDFYGRLAVDLMKRQFELRSICIALEEVTPSSPSQNQISKIIQDLSQLTNVSVIILITSESIAFNILQEAQRQKLYWKTWIGTDAWGTSPVILDLAPEVIGGVIGIAPESPQPPGQLPPSFENIIDTVERDQLKTMIDELLNCSHGYQDCYLSVDSSSSSSTLVTFSSSSSKIEVDNAAEAGNLCRSIKQYSTDKGNKVGFIIDAVYILASALHQLLNCTSRHCINTDTIDRKAFLKILHNIDIVAYHNHTLKFTSYREIDRPYIIDNIHFSSSNNGSCGHYQNVGNWYNRTLVINKNLMRWNNGTSLEVPTSRCSNNCSPGYKKIKPDRNSCCWLCLECGPGLVSNGQTSSCMECQRGQIAAPNHTICINLTVTKTSLTHPAGIAITISALAIGIINSIVLSIYIKYQHTPVVKASNSFLSFFHLATIYLMLGISVLIMVEPTTLICAINLSLLPISLILCIAVLITRTHHIASIFQLNFSYLLDTTTSIAKAKRTLKQVAFAILLTFIGVMIVAIVNIIQPVQPMHDYRVTNSVYYICDSPNPINLALPAGYFVFLCLLCNLFAWKTRNLPGNFNEAKHIFFCCITVLIIISLALPSYIQIYGILRTVIASMALQCSAVTVLVFLFFPKVYTMIITPHLNTKQRCLESIQTFSFSNSPFGNGTGSHAGPESTTISRSNSCYAKKSVNTSLSNNNHAGGESTSISRSNSWHVKKSVNTTCNNIIKTGSIRCSINGN